MKLKDSECKNAKGKAKPYKLGDGKGLYLEVTPKGAKYWRLKYRMGDKEKRLSIGVYPAIKLKEARQAMLEAKELIALGIDPSLDKQKKKALSKTSNANTFEAVGREWLKDNANPVDKDDLERHDKWLCMMWPRLQLLRELLADDGAIAISIDENEYHNLIVTMNEIFSVEKPTAVFVWKRRTGANDSQNMMSIDHEYIAVYGKSDSFKFQGTLKDFANYTNLDGDVRGDWITDNLTCNKTKEERPNLYYPITDPRTGITYEANPKRVWGYEKERMKKLILEEKVLFPKSGKGTPNYKRHKAELRSNKNPVSSWMDSSAVKANDILDEQENTNTTIMQAPLNAVGTKELRSIFQDIDFPYPKPSDLVAEIVKQVTDLDSIVLDSFAGSGTTAHATLALNKEDGGNRKFILVEMEDYANDITAERGCYRPIADILYDLH